MTEQAKRAAREINELIIGAYGAGLEEYYLAAIIDSEFADVMAYVEYVENSIEISRALKDKALPPQSLQTFSEWRKGHK
jgi:hypothetical protein